MSTQPQAKYPIDSTVFYLDHGKILECTVESVKIKLSKYILGYAFITYNIYDVKGSYHHPCVQEKYLYKSVNELLRTLKKEYENQKKEKV